MSHPYELLQRISRHAGACRSVAYDDRMPLDSRAAACRLAQRLEAACHVLVAGSYHAHQRTTCPVIPGCGLQLHRYHSTYHSVVALDRAWPVRGLLPAHTE